MHPLKLAHERQWRDFWQRISATTPFEPTGIATVCRIPSAALLESLRLASLPVHEEAVTHCVPHTLNASATHLFVR